METLEPRVVGDRPVYEGQGVLIWVVNETDDPRCASVRWAHVEPDESSQGACE